MATSLAPVRGVKNQGRPWLTSERSTLFRDLPCGTALASQRAYEEGLPPSPYVRLRRVATAADNVCILVSGTAQVSGVIDGSASRPCTRPPPASGPAGSACRGGHHLHRRRDCRDRNPGGKYHPSTSSGVRRERHLHR